MGRPRKIEGHADPTRVQLLRAAEREFGAVGYRRARLEDIAAAAGIRRSSLLYHFGSKAQLYHEVVGAVNADLRDALNRAMSEHADGMGRLDAVVTALLRFSQERRAGVSMFVRELLDSAPSGDEHIREFARLVDSLEQFIRSEAGQLIPKHAPLRAVLLHIVTSQALRVASGELGTLLWGEEVDPRLFLHALLTQR